MEGLAAWVDLFSGNGEQWHNGGSAHRPVAQRIRYKRFLDLSLLIGAHILLFPIFAILWIAIPLAIWLDDGRPIIFRQRRAGLNGKPFVVYKFRTMSRTQNGPSYTADNDPRVTRVGKFLRRTALDELPQLLNIWKGDMSFVGPRALEWGMHEEYVATVPAFEERYRVPPGLTGYAALHLPRHCGPEMRLKEDLRYVARVGFWTDVGLILRSAVITLVGNWGRGPRQASSADGQADAPVAAHSLPTERQPAPIPERVPRAEGPPGPEPTEQRLTYAAKGSR